MKYIETKILIVVLTVSALVFFTTITTEVKAEDPITGLYLVKHKWDVEGWCCTCRPYENRQCLISEQCCRYIPPGQPGGCPEGDLPCPDPPMPGGGGEG